jgi:hypothetical protein
LLKIKAVFTLVEFFTVFLSFLMETNSVFLEKLSIQ